MIGIDTHLAKTRNLYEKLGDARYRPCYLLEKWFMPVIWDANQGKVSMIIARIPRAHSVEIITASINTTKLKY